MLNQKDDSEVAQLSNFETKHLVIRVKKTIYT